MTAAARAARRRRSRPRAARSRRSAVFEADRFDLIVTDIRMPGMDGHAFLAEIRARDPGGPGHRRDRPRIRSTTRSGRSGTAPSGMLMKPFTGEEFQAEVRAALERSRIRREALQYTYVTPILDGVALALTAAIEARDLETGEHCQQLGLMGERVAILMGLTELDPDDDPDRRLPPRRRQDRDRRPDPPEAGQADRRGVRRDAAPRRDRRRHRLDARVDGRASRRSSATTTSGSTARGYPDRLGGDGDPARAPGSSRSPTR